MHSQDINNTYENYKVSPTSVKHFQTYFQARHGAASWTQTRAVGPRDFTWWAPHRNQTARDNDGAAGSHAHAAGACPAHPLLPSPGTEQGVSGPGSARASPVRPEAERCGGGVRAGRARRTVRGPRDQGQKATHFTAVPQRARACERTTTRTGHYAAMTKC